MKRSTLGVIILVGTFFLLSSCTTILFVNKPLDPEIELDGEGQTILIQNFFDYTKPEYVKEKHSEVFKAATVAFSSSLSEYLSGSKQVSAIIGDSLITNNIGRVLSELLHPDYIRATCADYGTDMLLALDSLNIDFDWVTETVENDDGSKSKTKYFYLQLSPFLSLYDYNGVLIDRSSVPMELLYSSRPTLTGLITIKPALLKALDEIILLSLDAGIEYGAKFFESTGSFPYKVYYGKPFDKSFRLMQMQEWGDAVRDLLPLASSSDKKIAKRAAHNLWVAYSGLGDETSAAEWLKKSL